MKSCCCGTEQQQNAICDPCPPPFFGFDDIRHRVTVVTAGIENCACGDGVNVMNGQAAGGGEFAGGCGADYLNGNGPCNDCLNTSPSFLDGGQCGFRSLRMRSVTWPNNFQSVADCRPGDCVERFCDVCAPTAVATEPFPAQTHTLEVRGCVYHPPCQGDGQLPGCVGYPNPNLCAVHPNYCGSYANGQILDDIGDGVISMKIHRCVRPGSCAVGGGGTWNCLPVHGALNGQTYSAVVVMFVGPDITYYDSYIACVPDPQGVPGAGTLTCYRLGPYMLPPQTWLCVYAKPQMACEWFAVGSYRLVGFSTTGCVGSWRINNQPGTAVCDFEQCVCTGALSACDWENGVDTTSMYSKWKPPSSITVSRLQ